MLILLSLSFSKGTELFLTSWGHYARFWWYRVTVKHSFEMRPKRECLFSGYISSARPDVRYGAKLVGKRICEAYIWYLKYKQTMQLNHIPILPIVYPEGIILRIIAKWYQKRKRSLQRDWSKKASWKITFQLRFIQNLNKNTKYNVPSLKCPTMITKLYEKDLKESLQFDPLLSRFETKVA